LGVESEVREGQENALVGEDISFLFTVIYFGTTQVVTLVGFDPKLNFCSRTSSIPKQTHHQPFLRAPESIPCVPLFHTRTRLGE